MAFYFIRSQSLLFLYNSNKFKDKHQLHKHVLFRNFSSFDLNFLSPIFSKCETFTCYHGPFHHRNSRLFSSSLEECRKSVAICGQEYPVDQMTNVTPKILSTLEHRLHQSPHHPLYHLKHRLVKFLHTRYHNKRGNPLFSVLEDLPPVVTVQQNFDQLLVPLDHVCRNKRDNYYINSKHLLRAHTSAHQSDLLTAGLNNFVVVGDVYRRDEIDSTHYPVFHQMEGVKLYTAEELLPESPSSSSSPSSVILTGAPSSSGCSPGDQSSQACHTPTAVAALTADLQDCLQGMTTQLFGAATPCRWVPAHFPFTQPSWELEVLCGSEWLEVLGCGVIQQRILDEAGVQGRVGWAFGLGLERWAMKLYGIPDIRLFWSRDSGFLSQFDFDDHHRNVQYKPVSVFPPCTNDISFWLPQESSFDSNDFYDLVRQVAGDLVEQVSLVDAFTHPKTGRTSHCYRVVYRHMERNLTQEEVNVIHTALENAASERLRVLVR